jgi:hypothetical protein
MRIGFPLALGVLAAAASVRADDLVACASNDAVFVERISGDQVEAVYQEPALNRFTDQPGALSWGWSDARTLWVLRKQGAALSVVKIVELQAEPPREIALADFKLTREPTPIAFPPGSGYEPPPDPAIDPGLVVTTTGQVWLFRCLVYLRAGDCRLGYLRLDRSAPLTTRYPANAVDSEPTLPSVPAPPGYSAALRTVKARGFTFRGAECKGPNGQWQSSVLDEVWPPVNANFHDRSSLAELAEVRVVKADWVRTAPPVARFVSSKRGLTWVRYVEDCTDERPAPVLLQDGRWIDRELVRRADGSEIGSLQGSQRIMVAPRP